MEMRVSFDAKAVLEAMDEAPETTVRHMRRALLESCRLVQRGAREVHRYKPHSGELTRAVRYRTQIAKCEGAIDINPAIAPYGVYVHEPTGKYGPRGQPYPIVAKNKKFLRFKGRDGKYIFRRSVMHPGSKADPFLYDSAERNREEINDIFARHTKAAVKEAGL